VGKTKFATVLCAVVDLVVYFSGLFHPKNKDFLKKGCAGVKVYKSINNNIVSAIDDDGREVVVIGKGIGFKAREGMVIPREKISKVFVMSSQDNLDRLKDLFGQLQKEYIEITDEILTYAKQQLNKKINENAYFTLADHISFAVARMREGMRFQNILTAEVRRFYPEEFKVGMYARGLILEKTGVDMPEDEAASIALHILNAQYDISFSEGFKATQLLGWIISTFAKHTGKEIDPENDYGERFITHLKYLVHRIIRKDVSTCEDTWLYDMLRVQYPKEVACCEAVAADILEAHQYKLGTHQIGYMAMHIRRIGL